MLKREWHDSLACLIDSASMEPRNARKQMRKGVARRMCGDLQGAVSDLRLSLQLLKSFDYELKTDDARTAKRQLGITLNKIGMQFFEDQARLYACNQL